MDAPARYSEDLDNALRRFGDQFPVRISLRVPGSRAVLLGESLGPARWCECRTMPFGDAVHGDWVPHATVYRERPDAGAVITFQTRWTSILARLNVPVPPLFDEQVRHLGDRIGGFGLRPLRRGGCGFLLGGDALCIGFEKDRAIFNAELLQKCCQAFVLAYMTAKPMGRIPLYVRFIAARRLAADRRRAAAAWERDEVPRGLGGY